MLNCFTLGTHTIHRGPTQYIYHSTADQIYTHHHRRTSSLSTVNIFMSTVAAEPCSPSNTRLGSLDPIYFRRRFPIRRTNPTDLKTYVDSGNLGFPATTTNNLVVSFFSDTMASDAKRRRQMTTVDTAVDRISYLPGNLKHLVLQCLPIRDAARTSILSRQWRNMWGTLPQLVFNDDFFAHMVSKYDKKDQLPEVSKTITSILFVHSGPILKFHLSIPEGLPLYECRDMYLWIKNLSNNGVRELELLNKALGKHIIGVNIMPSYMFSLGRYNVPSYMLSCQKLTHLKLTECVLNPTLGYVSFCNLISVQLEGVTITADMTFGAQLKDLDLERCIGIEHLRCQFKPNNNLTALMIKNCGPIDRRWFRCTHKVQVLGLWFGWLKSEAYEFNEEVINFNKLVGNMPEIHLLIIDNYFLELLEPVTACSLKLTTSMENLNGLSLYGIEFYNLHQMQYVLCLILSSPNLQILYIELGPIQSICDYMEAEEIEEHLLLPHGRRILAGQLETVTVAGMMGSLAELLFVKLLLASTPLLRLMKLEHTLEDPKEELRISQKLLQSPKASTAARIMWSYRKSATPGNMTTLS